MGIFALVLLLNYLRSKYLLASVRSDINRPFYAYFVAIAAYLLLYQLFTARSFQWATLFRILFWLSVVASAVGVAAVVLHLPLALGGLRYSVYDYSSGAVRVGFLETFGTLGMALVLTSNARFRLGSGLLFAAALVASGGRAAVLGAVVAIGFYLITTRRQWLVAVASVVGVAIALTVPGIGSSPQLQRLTQITPHESSSDGRLYIYNRSLEAFAQDPLIGTGLGVPTRVANRDHTVASFYEQQLELGGHATYAALLKNFGLLGFLSFIAAALLALVWLAPLARSDPAAGFFLILLAAELVTLFASGNGADPVYFFALAGGSAVLASQRRRADPLAG